MQMDLRLTKFVQVSSRGLKSKFKSKINLKLVSTTNVLFPLFSRKRTQALKFKMSFWSFCCGDNQGEKRGHFCC